MINLLNIFKAKKDYGYGKKKAVITFKRKSKSGKVTTVTRHQEVGKKKESLKTKIIPKAENEKPIEQLNPSTVIKEKDNQLVITGTSIKVDKATPLYNQLKSIQSKDRIAFDKSNYRTYYNLQNKVLKDFRKIKIKMSKNDLDFITEIKDKLKDNQKLNQKEINKFSRLNKKIKRREKINDEFLQNKRRVEYLFKEALNKYEPIDPDTNKNFLMFAESKKDLFNILNNDEFKENFLKTNKPYFESIVQTKMNEGKLPKTLDKRMYTYEAMTQISLVLDTTIKENDRVQKKEIKGKNYYFPKKDFTVSWFKNYLGTIFGTQLLQFGRELTGKGTIKERYNNYKQISLDQQIDNDNKNKIYDAIEDPRINGINDIDDLDNYARAMGKVRNFFDDPTSQSALLLDWVLKNPQKITEQYRNETGRGGTKFGIKSARKEINKYIEQRIKNYGKEKGWEKEKIDNKIKIKKIKNISSWTNTTGRIRAKVIGQYIQENKIDPDIKKVFPQFLSKWKNKENLIKDYLSLNKNYGKYMELNEKGKEKIKEYINEYKEKEKSQKKELKKSVNTNNSLKGLYNNFIIYKRDILIKSIEKDMEIMTKTINKLFPYFTDDGIIIEDQKIIDKIDSLFVNSEYIEIKENEDGI